MGKTDHNVGGVFWGFGLFTATQLSAVQFSSILIYLAPFFFPAEFLCDARNFCDVRELQKRRCMAVSRQRCGQQAILVAGNRVNLPSQLVTEQAAVLKKYPEKLGAVELWVVRHGETEDNKTRTIAGHNAGKLSALGITQVALTAGRETKREEEGEREYNSALSIELQLFRLHSYS